MEDPVTGHVEFLPLSNSHHTCNKTEAQWALIGLPAS